MERLAREKIASQQRLSALKKELSAQWDHIDFNTLLPDVQAMEPSAVRDHISNSTTTASGRCFFICYKFFEFQSSVALLIFFFH